MLHARRIKEWRKVVADFCNAEPWHRRAQALVVAFWKMGTAMLSGPVPRDVWQDRIRICAKCEVKSRNGWVCHRVTQDGVHLGCRCYIPYLALSAAPTKDGCWVHELTENEGWPAHTFTSRRAKLKAVVRFVLNRK